ncbi:MAG: hypothetical protein WDN04_23355 [Rhodospirillales bacterium]
MHRVLATFSRLTEEWVVLDQAAQGLRALSAYAALASLAATLALGAVGCAAAALWIWARRPLGPVGAPLLVAATLAIGAAIAVVLMRGLWRRHRVVSAKAMVQATGEQALLPVRLASAAAQGFVLGLIGQRASHG